MLIMDICFKMFIYGWTCAYTYECGSSLCVCVCVIIKLFIRMCVYRAATQSKVGRTFNILIKILNLELL